MTRWSRDASPLCTASVKHGDVVCCAEFEERPRRVKVFVQPHAGKKQGMMHFNTHVLPLLQVADVTMDLTRESRDRSQEQLRG